MKSFLKNEELLEALNNRYAVKKFEKRDTISKDLEDIVTSILQLTPTSFGLQAYKFLIIKDEATRWALKKHSWDQSQVIDADMFVVFCVPTNFDITYIQKHMENMQHIRWMDNDKKEGITAFMNNKIIETGGELWITNYEEWLTRQAYIGLWNLMTSLSIIGIDSCPMEWLNPMEYNKILGLDALNLTSKVAIAIGKRSPEDKYQFEKKARFSKDDLFITI